MPYYTTQILSAHQELTPEGYLVCKNVAIARTGVMLYAAGEVPIEARDGLIRIERTADEVFRAETMASFEGKAVTLDHPAVDVGPSNWTTLARGTIQNVRRGAGLEDDLLLADLLIQESTAISAVRDGLREVSCGYEADYEQTEPGRGRQTNIIGNHVALVEKGRCGSRCAIGDSEMKKPSFLDKIRRAFQANDEAALEEALTEKEASTDDGDESEEAKKEEAEEKTGDSVETLKSTIDTLSARVAALESTRDGKATEEESEEEPKDKEADGKTSDESSDEDEKEKTADSEGDEDEKKEKTSDSAALVGEARDVFARAEILAPGIGLPTFDAQADAQKTRDGLCRLRRKALQTAFTQGTYRDAITPFVGATPDFQKLTCDGLAMAFTGASEIVRRQNNATQAKVTFDGAQVASRMASTISAINKRNSDFWNRG